VGRKTGGEREKRVITALNAGVKETCCRANQGPGQKEKRGNAPGYGMARHLLRDLREEMECRVGNGLTKKLVDSREKNTLPATTRSGEGGGEKKREEK